MHGCFALLQHALHGQSRRWLLKAPPSGMSDLIPKFQPGKVASDRSSAPRLHTLYGQEIMQADQGSMHLAPFCECHAACAVQLVNAFA